MKRIHINLAVITEALCKPVGVCECVCVCVHKFKVLTNILAELNKQCSDNERNG